MSIPLTINGVTFQYPQEFDTHWGPTLTNWSQAVTDALVPIEDGVLTLTPYPNSGVNFANATNTGFLSLTVNGSNQLTFNGTPIGATVSLTDNHIFVGNVSNQPADVAMSGDIGIVASGLTTIQAGTITDSKVAAGAAIAVSKLAALTASRLVVTNGSGILTTLASPTLTEIGYVAGVTSAIQTQLNSITTDFLPLSGGTMSGPINMGNTLITGLTQGTSAGQAIAFPIGSAQLAANSVSQILQSSSSTSGPTTPLANAISSVTITTTGGVVVLMATISGNYTKGSFASVPQVTHAMWRDSITTPLAWQDFNLAGVGWTNSHTIQIGATLTAIDTPSAGTYTYHTGWAGVDITVPGSPVNFGNLVVIELKH